MKVLLCFNACNTDGGATRSCAYFAKEMRKAGNEVVVLLPSNKNECELLDELFIRHYGVKHCLWVRRRECGALGVIKYYAGQLYNCLVAIPRIKKLIASEKIDVVGVNNSWIYAPGLAAIKIDVPVIWHIREYTEEDFPEYHFVNRNRSLRVIGKADKTVAVSKGVAAKYASELGDSKVTCVYNGISETEFFYPEHPLFQSNCLNMVIVGKVCKTKGQHLLIQALHIVLQHEENLQFRLVVAGAGEKDYMQFLEEEAERFGLGDRVVFRGSVKDVASLYRDADVAFMCSKSEAFGRVTVEAMLSGCLVIGSNSGGTAEIIQSGNTGYLYSPCSADSLAEVIVNAISSPEKSTEVAKRGQAHALANYTSRENATRLERIYLDALSKHGIACSKN